MLNLEANLIQALKKSPDFVTYIPSFYSTTWTSKDLADPSLGPLLSFLRTGRTTAKENGVPTTIVYSGIFEPYWFAYGLVYLRCAATNDGIDIGFHL